MDFVIQRKKEYLSEDGLVLCEVDIALPSPIIDGDAECRGARLKHFYSRIEAAVRGLANREVLPAARTALEEIAPPRRRGAWRAFRLAVESRAEERPGYTELTRSLTLSHRGKRLFSESTIDLILADGRIIPKRERAKKDKKVKA